MENPIRKVRGDLGLTIRAFAGLLGVSIPLIQETENGVIQSPQKILNSLGALGYNREELSEQYDFWRMGQGMEAMEKFRKRGEAA